MELLDHSVYKTSTLRDNVKRSFNMVVPIHPPPMVWENFCCSIISPTLDIIRFLNFCQLVGVKFCFGVVLIYIPLVTNEFERLFMCLWAIHILSSLECLSLQSVFLLCGLFLIDLWKFLQCTLLLILCQLYMSQRFPNFGLFYSLSVSFDKQNS